VPAGPAYHFPPQEHAADYGYNQQYAAPAQWGQPADQRGYGVASYLPADPPPFQQTSHSQQSYGEPDYADEFYEDEEPRRGTRWLLIAVALVGAIGVGGALAYTYRSLIASNSGGRVPVVKNEPNAVKVRPEQRGGREFPGSDRKLPNQAGAVPPPPPKQVESEGAETPAGGPRQVRTIPVGPQHAAVPPPAVSVPGITLQNAGPPPSAEPQEADSKVAALPTPQVTTTTQAPPPAEAAQEGDPPPAASPPPAPRSRPTPTVAPSPPPQAARGSPQRAAPAASVGLGYVVVLASKKTHMDAVKAYADVHEKHAQVLSGKTPDVQEADLGEKGIFYRAVVGPPVSREAAMNLCGQLKAAGQDCWVKAF
jgi:hypothetical protein